MTQSPPAGCPFHGRPLTHQDGPPADPSPRKAPDGMYHVHTFEAARTVLRHDDAHQAGFLAGAARQGGVKLTNQPVLFAEGAPHHDMRRQTARYFTPAAVAGYQGMMAALADDLIAQLARRGEADLDDLSLKLAVGVAAQVVGLTSSALPGLERRVMSFVEGGLDGTPGARQRIGRTQGLKMQAQIAAFYLLDVKPAILARRRRRRDDLISHLLDRDYSDVEIVTECLTYATAGMVTTREFISVAAWHLLRDPALRAAYVHGTETERHALLHEILRLEPVVRTLYRQTQADLDLSGHTIPAGSTVALHVTGANLDPQVVGSDPQGLCPARPLPRGVQAQVLAFGDGHHRCPGAFLAIKESDVFLRRLLILGDLELVSPPTLSTNATVQGYELRGFRVRLGRGKGRLSA